MGGLYGSNPTPPPGASSGSSDYASSATARLATESSDGGHPDPREFYTANDLPDDVGVVRVHDQFGDVLCYAVVNDHGFLESFDGAYVRRDDDRTLHVASAWASVEAGGEDDG